jgi:CRP/FNR family transcriptional regulator, cyclic AMP receptor protein
MAKKRQSTFDSDKYLSTIGPGRTTIRVPAKQTFSSQGDPADCLFYLRTGRAKLTIVSEAGKEATVTLWPLAISSVKNAWQGQASTGVPAL